ncbi:MAG: PIN domain-containing protein [Mediterranea sp.]|jgi:tRNA(fMet)-specific endonuclease VapC|nr:PIN domain-containing protein [Mediterranea sp.]
MAHYLLDTNICIFYMKGLFHLEEKITDSEEDEFYISEITVGELLYGASCSDRKREVLEEVEIFISRVEILPIYESLSCFADTKAHLRARGQLIDDFDLLIAASAVYNDYILITDNVKHMARVPHIKIENWIQRT